MSESSTQPIIVGVSGTGDSEGALRFAVEEAVRQRCGVTIVHALTESLPPPAGKPHIRFGRHSEGSHEFVDGPESAEAYRLVTDTARRARAMSGGRVEVDTRIPVGRLARAIVSASENARLIVVQHHDIPVFERIFAHSTSVGVSARAHCPVVTVPPIWDPELSHNRVTVGIESFDRSADVLRIAFESAERRRARLDVLHAWAVMRADVDIIADRSLAAEWQQRSERELAELLIPWQRQFPQVQVDQHIVQQGPVDVLLQHSKESDLLILGRFKAAIPVPLHLGSIARAMIRAALCPVEIVPHSVPTRHVRADGLGTHN